MTFLRVGKAEAEAALAALLLLLVGVALWLLHRVLSGSR